MRFQEDWCLSDFSAPRARVLHLGQLVPERTRLRRAGGSAADFEEGTPLPRRVSPTLEGIRLAKNL